MVRARFVSNMLIIVLAAALAALSLSLTPAAVGWVAFGVGCAALLIAAVALPARGRGTRQRVLDVMVMILAGWTILASRAFGVSVVRWLSLSEAAVLGAAGIAGLIAHQRIMERAVRRAAGDLGVARPAHDEFELAAAEQSRMAAW